MPDTAPTLSLDDPSLEDRRWIALLARDATPACGPFLYGVTTQGVFCLLSDRLRDDFEVLLIH